MILPASEISEQIQIACVQFLEVLTPEQRRKAILPFDANDRFRWHYVPVEMFPRQGLPLEEMKVDQKRKAFSLLAASLSEKGYQKACSIINLENILGEIDYINTSALKVFNFDATTPTSCLSDPDIFKVVCFSTVILIPSGILKSIS